MLSNLPQWLRSSRTSLDPPEYPGHGMHLVDLVDVRASWEKKLKPWQNHVQPMKVTLRSRQESNPRPVLKSDRRLPWEPHSGFLTHDRLWLILSRSRRTRLLHAWAAWGLNSDPAIQMP
ncbi:hypothetical protein VNO77_19388 [Canavalia gladiata]|uniref:Uncharacterized protein n=1 Tax=Canavalia gladiata TaxID=3824 RepID=A0AAN9LMK0_CANGL